MAKGPPLGMRGSKDGAPGKSRVSRSAPHDAVVTIRAHDGRAAFETHVTRAAKLERLAEEWTYILRARQRWTHDPSLRQTFCNRALEDLQRAGVRRAFIRRLASINYFTVESQKRVNHVEVELHKWDPADADATRIHEAASEIPWEYLISAGTRGEGRFQSIVVTRLFRNETPAVAPQSPEPVLFIESAPGRLEDEYEFESERVRIRAAVGADGATPDRVMEFLETPQISDLEKTVRTKRWEMIHVTGVDTHQATQYIEDIYDAFANKQDIWKKIAETSGRIRDGMILRQGNIAELPVSYAELARVLVNPKKPPSLVTLNLYHSGARTARELVNQGAHAALGFLDEIDDELAELFFQAFYWAWCRPGGAPSMRHALAEAWEKMSGAPLHGTAIVIWMGRSVFEKFRASRRTSAQQTAPVESREARLARLNEVPIGQLLQVEFVIDEEINYSLLHNDRQLLNKLTLTKLVKEPLEDITVQVELNLGTQYYPFRCTRLVFDEAQLILAPAVRIPLTATLPRSLRERVQSTVYVRVTCGGRTAFETTERVTLIPVDEWLDDTDSNPWLPSFVLPRDPAILKIINSSRRYLVGITDDPAAGFDGYQSVDQQADEPSAGVDAQVCAIWTALVNEYRLQYINPPPAYSKQTQRLRTPSDILASNTGTCIDLALLLASCLEYIDIYPVIVLLSGHAFVGYWRSEDAHDAFVMVQDIPTEVPAVGSRTARKTAAPYVERYGWHLTCLNYNEIMEFVTAGDLVMLEATYLTSATGFAEAVKEGRANLRSRSEFDSLLDIRLARLAIPPVTPLPIIDE
jgi:hypothetical protein